MLEIVYVTRGPARGMVNPIDQWNSISPLAPVGKPVFLKYLDPFRLILFHLVSRVLLPRSRCLSQVNCLEVWIIHCLLHRNKLNLGFMVLNHMGKNRIPKEKKAYVNLPYAFIVMQILEEHGVTIPPSSEFSSERTKYDESHILTKLKLSIIQECLCYRNSKLHGKVHWSTNSSGNLNAVGDNADTEAENEEDDEDDDEDEEDANVEFADFGSVRAQVEELSSNVEELSSSVTRLQLGVTARLDRFESNMQAQINARFDQQQEMFCAFMDRFPPSPQ